MNSKSLNRHMVLGEEKLIKLIEVDSWSRASFLNSLLAILNAFSKESGIISLDGDCYGIEVIH